MFLKKIAACALFIAPLSHANHTDSHMLTSCVQLFADTISLPVAKTVITGYLSFVYGGLVISDLDQTHIALKYPKIKKNINLMSSKNKWICGGTYASLLALTQSVDENSPESVQYAVKTAAALMLGCTTYWGLPALFNALNSHAQNLYSNIKTKVYASQDLASAELSA